MTSDDENEAARRALLGRIQAVLSPHLKALGDDLEAEFPDRPDLAFALALGIAVEGMQRIANNPDFTARLFNIPARGAGYVLRREHDA